MIKRIILLITTVALLTIISCKPDTEKINENKFPKSSIIPQKVSVEVLKIGGFAVQTISNGILKPSLSADLLFEVSGIIENIYFKNGQSVSKGEIIATLKNYRQQLDLKKAEEQLKATNTELSSLLLGFGGIQGDTNSVDNQLLQNLKTQSGYSMALLNLKSAQFDYESTFIKAPFNGTLARIEKQEQNQILSSEPFCTLLNNDFFIAHFTIIEQELTKVKLGQEVKIYPIAFDGFLVHGTVTEIDPLIDDNGLIKVKALIKKPNTKNKSSIVLLSGMNIRVIIEEKMPGQLFIPKSALVLRSGKEVVFTFSKNKAKWNYVETKGENSTSYLIGKGLNENDTIIIKGGLNLAHDAVVEISKQQ